MAFGYWQISFGSFCQYASHLEMVSSGVGTSSLSVFVFLVDKMVLDRLGCLDYRYFDLDENNRLGNKMRQRKRSAEGKQKSLFCGLKEI